MNASSSHRTDHAKRCLRLSVLAAALMGLSACATVNDLVNGDKVDYRSGGSKIAPPLEVPPDLTQLAGEARYSVPGAPVTASGFQSVQSNTAQSAMPTAATAIADIRIERAGNQRWLVVKRSPDNLWDPVRDFWKDNGFVLISEDQRLGIMETDFAENRAKLPQDIIRRTLGRVIDNLYSTGEKDKFRTRLERTADGHTEIYISHRGMVELVQGGSAQSGGGTIWQPRPADPELEAEFLRRLMIRLGVSEEQARAVSALPSPAVARVGAAGNLPTVEIDEGFDRAWRRVGLSLDRTGFTVEDRDRAQGLYFVRYVEPGSDQKDKGLFARMFSSSTTPAPLKYRIALRSEANRTTVTVLNAEGQPDTTANAKRIVQVIAEDLK